MESVAAAIIPSIPTPGKVVWEKVRALLAKNPLTAVDITEIKKLEESLIATHRHTQLIVVLLIKKAEEENPDYYDYALQMADTMGVLRAANKTMIAVSKEKNKLIKI